MPCGGCECVMEGVCRQWCCVGETPKTPNMYTFPQKSPMWLALPFPSLRRHLRIEHTLRIFLGTAALHSCWWVLQHCTGFARLVWGKLRVHRNLHNTLDISMSLLTRFVYLFPQKKCATNPMFSWWNAPRIYWYCKLEYTASFIAQNELFWLEGHTNKPRS